jgi:hypothetical protein
MRFDPNCYLRDGAEVVPVTTFICLWRRFVKKW